jgi:hypothetical protein
MQEPNGLKKLTEGNNQLFIDGMVSKAVTSTEFNIDFFRNFDTNIDASELKAFRTAWEKFRNTIDVSI